MATEKKTQIPTMTLLLMRDALRAAVRHARQDPDAYPEGEAELIHQANDAYTDFVDARTGRLR